VREKVRTLAPIEALLPLMTVGEQPFSGFAEPPGEVGDEGECLRSEHFA
jgi:hypothetical protein